jgi:hypothetical protein
MIKKNLFLFFMSIFIYLPSILVADNMFDPEQSLINEVNKYKSLDYKKENIKSENTGFYQNNSFNPDSQINVNPYARSIDVSIVDTLEQKANSNNSLSLINNISGKDRIIRNSIQYQCNSEKQMFKKYSLMPNLIGIIGDQITNSIEKQGAQIADNLTSQITSVFESMSRFLSPEYVLEQIFKTYQKQIAKQTCQLCRAGNLTGCGGIFLVSNILKSPAKTGAEKQMIKDKAKMKEKETVKGDILEWGLTLLGGCPDNKLLSTNSGKGYGQGTRTMKRNKSEIELFLKSTERTLDDYAMEQCIVQEEQKAKAWLNQVINTIISSVDARQSSVESCLSENSKEDLLLYKNLTGMNHLKNIYFNNINRIVGENSLANPITKSGISKINILTYKPNIYKMAGFVDVPKPGKKEDKKKSFNNDITEQFSEILSETSPMTKGTSFFDTQIEKTNDFLEVSGYSSNTKLLIKNAVKGIVKIKKIKYSSDNYSPNSILTSLNGFHLKIQDSELIPELQKEFKIMTQDFVFYESYMINKLLDIKDVTPGEMCVKYKEDVSGDILPNDCLSKMINNSTTQCLCVEMKTVLPPLNNMNNLLEETYELVRKEYGSSSCNNCGLVDDYRARLNNIRREYIEGIYNELVDLNISLLKTGLRSDPTEVILMRKYLKNKTILLN